VTLLYRLGQNGTRARARDSKKKRRRKKRRRHDDRLLLLLLLLLVLVWTVTGYEDPTGVSEVDDDAAAR
jgi:hypothetical protein